MVAITATRTGTTVRRRRYTPRWLGSAAAGKYRSLHDRKPALRARRDARQLRDDRLVPSVRPRISGRTVVLRVRRMHELRVAASGRRGAGHPPSRAGAAPAGTARTPRDDLTRRDPLAGGPGSPGARRSSSWTPANAPLSSRICALLRDDNQSPATLLRSSRPRRRQRSHRCGLCLTRSDRTRTINLRREIIPDRALDTPCKTESIRQTPRGRHLDSQKQTGGE